MAFNSSSWNETFHEVFGCLQDKWNISEGSIESFPNISVACRDGWKQFQDKGKVHFECGVCKRSWSSVKGAVVFHYRLSMTGRGEVKVWCCGQKCNRKGCDDFEHPLWYQREIKRALGNLLIKVKEKFYEGPKKAVNANQLGGNMSAGHETARCQACQMGVCGRRDGYSASGAADGAEVYYDEDEPNEDETNEDEPNYDEQDDDYLDPEYDYEPYDDDSYHHCYEIDYGNDDQWNPRLIRFV